jgi:hypothetical protein
VAAIAPVFRSTLRRNIRNLRFRRERLVEADNLVQLIAKIFEPRSGDNDGIATTINLLDDSQEPAPRIFSQVEREMLALDSDTLIL